ncbi:MAG: heme exporter protein CcmD [Pseudomonadales bacterium]|nr:heme exporter protein CcmD [Pseudomonadales bacterium]
MAFENFNDFMTMCYMAPIGEIRCHGSYVWDAYRFGFFIVVAGIVAPIVRNKKIKQTIRRNVRRENAQNESKT